MKITEIVNALRKGTITCLPCILCLSCPLSNAESEMKLEELVQKLDAANPWTVERVENVLGSKLTKTYSTKTFASHTAGSFHYEEGLIIEAVELRLRVATNEMARLIVDLSDEASCFTLDRIKRTYPDVQLSPYPPSPNSLDATFGYWAKRPWGHISFQFKMGRPKCLSGITFIPAGRE